MALSDDDVREILRIIDDSELDELLVETEAFRLHVVRGGGLHERSIGPRPPERAASETTPQSATADDGMQTIESPMLGTFYRAEGAGKPPFVEVGSRVEPDTIVCIIEVMKMMNSVPAGVSGTVVEVCGANAQLVEYSAPLFRVQPA